MAGGQGGEAEIADADAEEAEGGVADGGGHAADLAVFAFDEFEADPAVGHAFPKADGRDAGRDFGLGFEQPGATGEGFVALDDKAAL